MGIRMSVEIEAKIQLFPMLDVAETPVIDPLDISEQIWTKMNSSISSNVR